MKTLNLTAMGARGGKIEKLSRKTALNFTAPINKLQYYFLKEKFACPITLSPSNISTL